MKLTSGVLEPSLDSGVDIIRIYALLFVFVIQPTG
jgi:hypothetical protein